MNRRKFLKWAAAIATTPAAGYAYARGEAHWLEINRHTLVVPRLPSAFAGLTVALLTDPHHGPFNSLAYVREVVDRTNALRPDLVALGGDYVHGARGDKYVHACVEALGRLRAPLGVYAVPGNHDYWHRIWVMHQALRDFGLTDLTNAGRWLERAGSRLRLAGIDDIWYGRPDLDAALGDATASDACVLVCHNPDFLETLTDRRVGLVLSGHMHGGQIVVPGLGYHRLPSRYGAKYVAGLVRTDCSQVFVSRGLGTVGLPLRFNCRPEIVLLTLT